MLACLNATAWRSIRVPFPTPDLPELAQPRASQPCSLKLKPMSPSFALFQTQIGTGGIAWSERGVRGVQLPEVEAPRVRARMKRRFPDAVEATPSPDIQQAIARMVALLNGETTDLTSVQLDLQDVPTFDRDVYAIARTIPI